MPSPNGQKHQNKFTMQFIAVFAAIVLWFVISYTEDPVIDVTFKNIRLEYRGIDALRDRSLIIPDDDKTTSVIATVNGKRSELGKALDTLSAYVDVSKIEQPGEYELDVKIDSGNLNVRVDNIRTEKLTVKIDEVSSINVPIVVEQTEKGTDYIIKSVPQNKTIQITGPETELARIAAVVATVDTSKITEDCTVECEYIIVGDNNMEISNSEMFYGESDTIPIYNEIYKMVTLPVDLIIPETVSAVYEITPTQNLRANVGVKDGSPERLTATFPENAITNTGVSEYTVALENTENVYITDGNAQLNITAEVKRKELNYLQMPVRITNIPAGYSAVCDESVIDTYVNCVPDKISKLKPEAYADVSGLKEGTHKVKLTFSDNGIKVIGEYDVNVTLKKE